MSRIFDYSICVHTRHFTREAADAIDLMLKVICLLDFDVYLHPLGTVFPVEDYGHKYVFRAPDGEICFWAMMKGTSLMYNRRFENWFDTCKRGLKAYSEKPKNPSQEAALRICSGKSDARLRGTPIVDQFVVSALDVLYTELDRLTSIYERSQEDTTKVAEIKYQIKELLEKHGS